MILNKEPNLIIISIRNTKNIIPKIRRIENVVIGFYDNSQCFFLFQLGQSSHLLVVRKREQPLNK